jgi:hypothetical protein
MRLPRLKMQQAMILVGVASVWMWLLGIRGDLVVVGTIVLALMLVSLRNKDRVAGEIQGSAGRAPALTHAGILCYWIAVVLALAWVGSIWIWQVIDHETLKKLGHP